MAGTLYVVGTPIGNLGDFSPRAAETLNACDFIAAEDTRVTLKLLNHFGIKKPMISYHEHNRAERGNVILRRLLSGESCALVSDAGMPVISDPGMELVALCREQNIPVAAVPGPCAFATALAVSGMPAGRFTFEGFLTTSKQNRKKHLDSLADETRTMIFYEAPHKLPYTLDDLFAAFGDRKLALVKELTKIHENVENTTLSAAAEKYRGASVKGEFVLIVEGNEPKAEAEVSLEEAVETAKAMIQNGTPPSEAAKLAAKNSSYKKSDIYKAIQNGE